MSGSNVVDTSKSPDTARPIDDRQRPRAILSAPGSRGDVNPMIAIARHLAALGFDCHLSVAEPYAEIVEAAGVRANVVMDRETFHRVASQTRFWRPWSGARRVLGEVAESFFHPHLQWIRQHYVPGRTVLVAHPLDFASRVFRDITPGCLLSSVHLAPAMLRHAELPPRLFPDRGFFRWALPAGWPRMNRLTYCLGDRTFLDRIVGPSINAQRRRAGLPARRRLMDRWWLSPDQLLGLYPSWFAPEIAEKYGVETADVAPLQCVGFPLDDGIHDDEPNADAMSSNGWRKTGSRGIAPPDDRPLLVTTGSAHPGDQKWVKRIAEIAAASGLSVVWCCPSNPGGVDHPNVRCVGYVPLGRWLPHCRGIIHHGGIGTTSRAIHASVPQLIRPMAFDQFDNAARVERFGLGIWLRRDADLPVCLEQLLAMGPLSSPHSGPTSDSTSGAAAGDAAHRIASLLPRREE